MTTPKVLNQLIDQLKRREAQEVIGDVLDLLPEMESLDVSGWPDLTEDGHNRTWESADLYA